MKFLIVFVALFAFALAAPPSVIQQHADVQPDGYSHLLEQDDGTKIQAQGQLRTIGKEQAITVTGSYAYADPDGALHEVKYIADENGYQPQSADLPVAPVA
ncbi:hypothetical protein KR044_004913 [Drosophila immigrans]|nr:hypothetical protein KR044_004913 [Drosophila immigrans]